MVFLWFSHGFNPEKKPTSPVKQIKCRASSAPVAGRLHTPHPALRSSQCWGEVPAAARILDGGMFTAIQGLGKKTDRKNDDYCYVGVV